MSLAFNISENMRIDFIIVIIVMVGLVYGRTTAYNDEVENRTFGIISFVQKGLCVGSKF